MKNTQEKDDRKKQRLLQRVLEDRVPVLPVRSSKPLTIPEEPKLATEQRSKVHRRSAVEANGAFKPVAQLVQEYQMKTPKRYHTRPKSANPEVSPQRKHALTQPRTPQLSTTARHRSPHWKASEEMEVEELANVPPFKARAVPASVKHGHGESGLKLAPKRPLTEAAPFRLATDSRASTRVKVVEEPVEEEEPPPAPFKARPLDKSMFSGGPKGVPEKQAKKLTRPKTPDFASNALKEKRSCKSLPTDEHAPFTARPLPPDFTPIKDRPRERKSPTKFEEFDLETEKRGTVKRQAHETQLHEEEHAMKKAREFHARPLFEFDTPPQTARSASADQLHCTRPEPFLLRSVILHNESVAKFQSKVQQESEETAKQREFKARPMNVSSPFFVRKSDAPLVHPESACKNSRKRAEDRRHWEEDVSKKHDEENSMRKKLEEEFKKQEEKELKALRANLGHKALPIMQPKVVFQPKRSTEKLTVPQSPKFRTRSRSALKDVNV
eukprot:Rmarinus@m.92